MKKEEAVLDLILTIASDMLRAGMEVRSVEEGISVMCISCGMEEVQVFTITSSILVSAKGEDGSIFTQSRRIKDYKTDFVRLEQLNKLAAKIATSNIDLVEIKEEVNRITEAAAKRSTGIKSVCCQYSLYCVISFIFSLFFGGSLKDGVAACLCGILIRSVFYLFDKVVNNRFLLHVMASASGGIGAYFLYCMSFADSIDKVIIGNIMLLIPGLAAVNACKDLIAGEMLSGLLRLVDAMIIAAAVAIGFSFIFFIW